MKDALLNLLVWQCFFGAPGGASKSPANRVLIVDELDKMETWVMHDCDSYEEKKAYVKTLLPFTQFSVRSRIRSGKLRERMFRERMFHERMFKERIIAPISLEEKDWVWYDISGKCSSKFNIRINKPKNKRT